MEITGIDHLQKANMWRWILLICKSTELKLHSLENGRIKPSMWCHVFQLYKKAGSFKELICVPVCQKLNIDTLCNCFINDHFSNSNERQSLCKVGMALLWKHRNDFQLELEHTTPPAVWVVGTVVWKCHKTSNLHHRIQFQHRSWPSVQETAWF